jgi:hypothetical protein
MLAAGIIGALLGRQMDRSRVLRSRLWVHHGRAQNDVIARAAAGRGNARGHPRCLEDVPCRR